MAAHTSKEGNPDTGQWAPRRPSPAAYRKENRKQENRKRERGRKEGKLMYTLPTVDSPPIDFADLSGPQKPQRCPCIPFV